LVSVGARIWLQGARIDAAQSRRAMGVCYGKPPKTSGKQDELQLLFLSGEHRRSPAHAKKKEEITGR